MTEEQLDLIKEMMVECGQALYDDGEWNAPVYRKGRVVGANGVNSFEASTALDAVAAVLKIWSPSDEYDRLCEESAERERSMEAERLRPCSYCKSSDCSGKRLGSECPEHREMRINRPA